MSTESRQQGFLGGGPLAGQFPEYREQLVALDLVCPEGACEPAFSFLGQAEDGNARVHVRLLSRDQAGLFGASYQIGDGGLREAEAGGELCDRRPLASVGGAFDQEEEQVTLRCQAVCLRDELALAEERSQCLPERRDLDRSGRVDWRVVAHVTDSDAQARDAVLQAEDVEKYGGPP